MASVSFESKKGDLLLVQAAFRGGKEKKNLHFFNQYIAQLISPPQSHEEI